MDLLELLAADEAEQLTTGMVAALKPGTRLTFDYCDWPPATLTVVSVRPMTAPNGTPTHMIRTTSDHPGPRWSSYDREWWAWFVAEYMTITGAA
jgi:hypothetical protein